MILNYSWWMHQIKKKWKIVLASLNLYLVFVAEILAVSSGNEMLGCVYHNRVTDVYRVFITLFVSNIEFYICFRLRHRWSFFLVIESQSILSLNALCYNLQLIFKIQFVYKYWWNPNASTCSYFAGTVIKYLFTNSHWSLYWVI